MGQSLWLGELRVVAFNAHVQQRCESSVPAGQIVVWCWATAASALAHQRTWGHIETGSSMWWLVWWKNQQCFNFSLENTWFSYNSSVLFCSVLFYYLKRQTTQRQTKQICISSCFIHHVSPYPLYTCWCWSICWCSHPWTAHHTSLWNLITLKYSSFSHTNPKSCSHLS